MSSMSFQMIHSMIHRCGLLPSRGVRWLPFVCATRTVAPARMNILGVRREWRKKGLELALLHHAFGEFYQRGIPRAILVVDAGSLTGATRLYERAGMRVERAQNTYAKLLREGNDLMTTSL